MSRHLREKEKAQLLEKIQQQRRGLADGITCWLEITAPYDRYWKNIVNMRHYLMAGASLLTVYGIRHPNKIIKWSRRVVGLWGTIKLIRRIFPS